MTLVESGINATVKGVMLAFTIPAKPYHTPLQFYMRIEELKEAFMSTAQRDGCSGHPLSIQYLHG